MLGKSGNFDIDNLRERFLRQKYSWKKVWKEIWPIDWSLIKKPKLVFVAISQASYTIKVLFVSFLIALIASFSIFLYGFYLISTDKVVENGGYFREAVVGGELTYFNPVLDRTDAGNEGEKKVNRLIYHPLYEVTYPDYLNDEGEKIKTPTITPILISEDPQWMDADVPNIESRYKNLKFTLKDNLKWSDGTDLTVDDVIYTFNRFKEDRSDTTYKERFKNITIKKMSPNEFKLVSKISDPQLIYLADFSPISKEYYESKDTESMWISPKSQKPLVTSGYFTLTNEKVEDPESTKKKPPMVDNPIVEGQDSNYRTIVLTKNPYQNYKDVYLDKYIIKRYDYTVDIGDSEKTILERDAIEDKVDLYTRFLGTNMNLSPEELKDKTSLQQKTTLSNTFYNAYFNIAPGSTGYLVNKSLRNYITCHLINYENSDFDSYLEPIQKDKRLIPIQFNESAEIDCSNPNSVLDPEVYTVESNERTGIKSVLLYGEAFQGFTIIGYKESYKLLSDLQKYFLNNIGIPVNLVVDETQVQNYLKNKNYNIAVLPVRLVDQDPYSIFGSLAADLSQINYNSRVRDYNVEDNLLAYSSSGLIDENSRENLINFFKNEYTSVNLFRAKNEYNYSSRVNELKNSIPDFASYLDEIYSTVPDWYTETQRRWKWSN